jgi:Protein of unknown function (DUF3237)
VAFDGLLSGAAAPPPQGARFDSYVEGTVTGPKLKGTVKGVDYANVRADGRLQLHVHAGITTEDCMSSEHFGRLAWQFKRMSGPSGLKV